MRRLAAFALACAAFWPAAALAQNNAPKPPLIFSDDTVGIGERKPAGYLILPQGTPPYPAVVVLHGCNGVSQNMRHWANRLAGWGYAAFVLDSFSERGIKNVCGHGMDFSGPDRAPDSFAAAQWMRTRPDIDSRRIGLIGFSHGGWTALAAARAKAAGNQPFAAVVAYYPSCPPFAPALASDTLILIGDADDWTSSRRCTDMLAKYAANAPHRPLLKIYPGATHAFDAGAPPRVYFGHRLAYDAAAAASSFDMTRQFFDDRLRTPISR